MSEADDFIAGLMEAGIIILVGFGLYKFIKSWGEYEKGDKVNEKEILSDISESMDGKPDFTSYRYTRQNTYAPSDIPDKEMCEECGVKYATIKCHRCGRSVCDDCSYSDYYCNNPSCYD